MSRNTKYNYNDNLIVMTFDKAQVPKFEEKKGIGKYIEFGKENNYPTYLIELFNESPKHGAIVKGKVNYIFGKGFDLKEKANANGQTWNDILKRSITDDELQGGYYLQIIPDKLGRISGVFNLDFQKVRTNKDCSKFFVKNDWKDNREKIRVYDAYTPKSKEPSILFIKQYNPFSDIYPLPSYYQGLNYIESDIQVSRHILGNAKQGFVATMLINLNNGEPVAEENKGEVERGIKKKFTGSEGERFVLSFNKNKESEVSIVPLGNTMLTKEDFTNINNLIQQEIFACHQITSPMLFGIKTEGQLGGRSEIVDAYEIFNNTYINERQQAHEFVFNNLINLSGIQGEFKIRPVKPLGLTLSEDNLMTILPREYFLEELGVDQKYYNTTSASGVEVAPSGEIQASNEAIRNLSGRQYQGVMRIVRNFSTGKLTKEQASIMLKSGYGFTDDDVNTFLGIDDNPETEENFAEQLSEEDAKLLEQFEQVFEDASQYEILESKSANYKEYFADIKKLTELQSNILNLISKDPKITTEVIAQTLNKEVSVINAIVAKLIDNKLIKIRVEKIGSDEVIKRELTKPLSDIPKEPSTVTEILVRYKYTGPQDSRNRPFCAKMLELSTTKLWSRSDIETISERLGYSVWDRRGGWFTMPDGEHRPYCRHSWTALTVIKKTKK